MYIDLTPELRVAARRAAHLLREAHDEASSSAELSAGGEGGGPEYRKAH